MARKKSEEISESVLKQQPKYTVNVYGHKEIESNFIKEWNNRDKIAIHPVWLLSGENGIGKATLAYKIARFVFRTMHLSSDGMFGDERPTSMDETENDSTYQKMLSGGFGDFFTLSTIQEDGTFSAIKLDDILEIISRLQLTSMEGEWRVCIIDKLDGMNRNCANSLLKILEEPPEKTLFILIADKLSSVLPTIRSRSHVEKLSPLSDVNLRKVIYDRKPDIDLTEDLIFLSNGSAGKAMYLINNGEIEFFKELQDLLYNSEIGTRNIMNFSKKAYRKPDVFSSIIAILLDIIHREALKNPSSEKSLELSNLYKETSELAKRTTSVYLDYETVLMQIIQRIRKCL